MGYLPRTAERRADVRNVVPSARSVIVTGTLYNGGQPYSTERNDPTRGEVARYAWSRDYHHVIGERLDALARMDERAAPTSRSTHARMSTPVPFRSGSTRSTPVSAGSARTRA